MKKKGFILRPVFLRLWIEQPGFGTMISVVVFYMDVGDLGSQHRSTHHPHRKQQSQLDSCTYLVFKHIIDSLEETNGVAVVIGSG